MNAPPKLPRAVTMTSREFNQHTSRAKAAADHGPVIITDRGKPAYVLTTYATYEASNPVPARANAARPSPWPILTAALTTSTSWTSSRHGALKRHGSASMKTNEVSGRYKRPV